MPLKTLRTRLPGLLAMGALAFALIPQAVKAQVLARPGMAGAGAAPEAWWHRAVLYRVDPLRFQDSDGDGRGDLQGLAMRLDYLQRLGVDGLLIDAAALGHQPEDIAFGDLLREASRRGIRLLIALSAGDGRLSGEARRWLSAGAAGIYLMQPVAGTAGVQGGAVQDNAVRDNAVRDLRQAVASFPAERVLLSDPAAPEAPSLSVANASEEAEPARRGRGRVRHESTRRSRSAPLSLPRSQMPRTSQMTAQMMATARLLPPPPAEGVEVSVATLRGLLAIGAAGPAPREATESLLLRLPLAVSPVTPSNPRSAALWRTLALLALASRGAAVVDYGAELGLNTSPDGVLMQWTPGNRTLPPKAAEERFNARPDARPSESTPAPPPDPKVYGEFHPYVRPPKGAVQPKAPAEPAQRPAEIAEPAAPEKVDADTLPGFTTAELPAQPIGGAQLNVAAEDDDPASLLNFYRRLIALHHDHPALQKGSPAVLDAGDGVLAWVRRAPPGSKTGSVIVVCNPGGAGVSLNLREALRRVGVAAGGLRALVSSGGIGAQTTEKLALPAYSVYVGEIVR